MGLPRPAVAAAGVERSDVGRKLGKNGKRDCQVAIGRMQELETENNRLFITAYGLQDELKPEVSEEQITLARADARIDMAAFVFYAVGCMMGRYSLDQLRSHPRRRRSVFAGLLGQGSQAHLPP